MPDVQPSGLLLLIDTAQDPVLYIPKRATAKLACRAVSGAAPD